MKKPFILLALLAFTLSTMHAQSFPVNIVSLKQQYSLPFNSYYIGYGKEISIAVNHNVALKYYEYMDVSNPMDPIPRGGFVYNSNATSINSFNLPDRVYVNDAKQVSNTSGVVFCGYRIKIIQLPGGGVTHTHVGVIGWFHINNYPREDRVQFLHWWEIPEIYEFTKVEPYINNSNASEETVVAIGQTTDDYHKHAIFYAEDYYNLVNTNLDYKIYKLQGGEYLTDIVRSERYLSFVGIDWRNAGVCIWKEKIADMGNPVQLDNRYTFAFPDDGNVHSEHATFVGNRMLRKKDTIAISTTHYGQEEYSCRFRFFDVDQMVMTKVQEYKSVIKNDIMDMTYVSDDRLLCPLMMNHPESDDPYSTVVLIDPLQTTTYSANLIFDTEYYYPRIDCIDYQYSNCKHILLGGGKTWFLKKVSNPASSNGCNETGTIEVKVLTPIDKIQMTVPLNMVEGEVPLAIPDATFNNPSIPVPVCPTDIN